jgi:glucan biosynthesis protein C
VLAVPLCTVLCFDGSWLVWTGIPTRDFGLTPKLTAMIGCGRAFAFGWLLDRRVDLLAAGDVLGT